MATVVEGATETLASPSKGRELLADGWLGENGGSNGGSAVAEREGRRASRAIPLLSDARLAAHAGRGDTAAFAELYRRHHQRLYRYCLSLLHDPEDAADVLQTTMAKALSALEGGDRVKGFRPWLFRIAHNAAIDLVRSRRPEAPLEEIKEIELSSLTAPTAASQAQRRAEVSETVADIRSLPRRQQSALVMRELSELPYAEIAGALETSPLAARQLVHQARSALHDSRSGREMDCEAARVALGERDGKRSRDRRVRAHLAACVDCASFGRSIEERRAALAAFAPPLTPVAASEMLGRLLDAGSTSGLGLSGAGSAAAGIGKLAAAPGLAKVAAAAAAGATAVAVAGGAVVVGTGASEGSDASSRPAATESLLDPRPPGVRAMPAPARGGAEPARRKASSRSASRRANRQRSSERPAERRASSSGSGRAERNTGSPVSSVSSGGRSDTGSSDRGAALPRIGAGAVSVPRDALPRSGGSGVDLPDARVGSPVGDGGGSRSVELPRGVRDLPGRLTGGD
jgi:RNA polymerase sigma factor (sigma-70 family)